MPYGVMGGHFQPMGQTWFLTNFLDYGLDMQESLDLPRLFPIGGQGAGGARRPRDAVRRAWRGSAMSSRRSSGRMAAARRSGSTAPAAA